MSAQELGDLLLRHRAELVRLIRREATGVLRFESVEDVVQGVHARALAAGDFEYRSEAHFHAWLATVARAFVADRADHWNAMKRGAGRVVRLSFTRTGSGDAEGAALPPGSATGPATFASRRELVELAVQALALLPERDRKLVRWSSEGVDLREQADRLGIGYAAVQRAAHRALERFRGTFELARRSADGA